MRKDFSGLNESRKGTFKFGKKDIDRMGRKYKLSDVGNVEVIDMLSEKIPGGATNITRYEEKKLSYHQNSFTRNLMVVLTFQMKSLMQKKLLNFGAIFG